MAPKSKTDVAPTNGFAKPAPATASEKKDTSSAGHSTKPDQKAYNEEQERLKKEIDAVQTKYNAVREKISLVSKGGNGNSRRTELRAELDALRNQQAGNKASRGKVLDQIKALQDGIAKKDKDIKAQQSKVPYRTVADVDTRIKTLEKQVESGNLKLADEKRAVQEISTCKRNRRTVEGFQAIQDAIDADKKSIEDLRAQLDDPEFRATADRFDAIRAELDELKKEGDEVYAGRAKLYSESDELKAQLNALYDEKRTSAQNHREAGDRYWNKVNEERARRAERARAERQAEEQRKKTEDAERIREEAEFPAFEIEIQDCQTVINYFQGKTTGTVVLKSAPDSNEKADIEGVTKLEARQVEAVPDGVVLQKKKGEDEDSYFVASKKATKKGKRGPKATKSDEEKLNVPLNILVSLTQFSIPLPTSAADVGRVVTDLQTKKAWFLANQDRVTKEKIAKAEARIKSLANQNGSTGDVAVPNGSGERPPEPAPTPKEPSSLSESVSTEAVDAKLESVEEEKTAADQA
ncbi:hypothetical protein CYLTODRAFT_435216 [Cylindrobasidium torrendii FP15055 ss-10]|uniref:Nuclear segregation protein Bfr1 n=1 Tax=Cylindrobasidium torrendii FP15055 ss-10 TaxID=1314674 RepID=A0A0D7BPA3_9AGAR|nr:hypothetical protein CYLTODRAFT_435216 [Cylindrobasidium torrendii FP15055 ss-10]